MDPFDLAGMAMPLPAARFGASGADLMPPPPVAPQRNVLPAFGLAGAPGGMGRDQKVGTLGFALALLTVYVVKRFNL